jgi:endonuclease/exonuclease/phosphatase family metal-dependent hydrolase
VRPSFRRECAAPALLRLGRRAASIAGLVALLAPPAAALRIVNYNLTNYPGSNSGLRNPKFRTVIGPLAPDVVVVQEMLSQTGVDSFRTSVLNTLEPGQWASAPFINGNDTDNALFYKTAKVQFLGGWSFYPNPATNLRLVNVYRLKPVGYTAAAAELRIYSCHLKASQGFEADRLAEAIGIRDSMNAMPPGTHAILLGDFNIYTSSEPAFQKFLESQADNDGRAYDPLNAVGTWNNNASFAAIHTQCPCLNNCPAGFGFAGGGMDDRFDMFLPTANLLDGQGLDLLTVTYQEVGNDGQHFNKDLNAAPVIPEGQTYADALVYSSDHLPLRVDLQLPAEITVSPALAFGTVIVGGPASQTLTVTNATTAPADNLDYSLAADPGFTAPGGSFSLAVGGSTGHTVTMSTATTGAKSGSVRVSSDAPDTPLATIPASGTVLAHAVASLESLTTTLAATLDFGDHGVGEFTDGVVRVHNRGYNSLQARLSVSSGTIVGGGGRFTIVGGFTPALVAGVSQPYAVHFDDTGATGDTTYTATLTFSSADEALPGSAAQPPLVVTLRARVLTQTDVARSLPTATRLYAPSPNPPGAAGTTIRLDLAQGSPVRLEVFDVAGRRVANLSRAPLPRGVHALRWGGHDDAGRPLGAGVYFVRLTVPGLATQTVRVTLLR